MFKKTITMRVLISAALLFTMSCGKKKGENLTPLTVDKAKGTITFLAEVNGKYFMLPSRHFAVFKDGSNGDKSIFRSLADHTSFYKALKAIGGKAGENMTLKNKEKTKVEGDMLDITVTWKGAGRVYSIDEVVNESNGRPITIRFGGNLERAIKKNTGCLICLDSCPVGIASNSSYTYGAVEKRKEVSFTGNRKILPGDKELVSITVKLRR